MATVANNVDAQPKAATPNDVTTQPATVVAAVSKPEAAETVNLVAKTDSKPPNTKPTEIKPPPTDRKQTSNSDTTTVTSSSGTVDGSTTFRAQPDDFYNAIFYFSGMGRVVGSALSEGVYVGEQYRKCAIDTDELANGPSGQPKIQIGFVGTQRVNQPDVVIAARGQAQNLSTDFQKLQTLLESLPVFTGNRDQLPPVVGSSTIDHPIHGELYFRCKERFPVQPSPVPGSMPSSRMAPTPTHQDSVRSSSRGSFESSAVSGRDEPRRRRNYDDDILADVAQATAAAFPLMPPPRQPSSRGSTTPVRDVDDQASRRSRRREANSAAVTRQTPSPGPSGPGYGYQQQPRTMAASPSMKSWQTPHVY